MRHFLIQVGTHTLFADRIDGYGKIGPFLGGGSEGTPFQFAVYLKSGTTLMVKGTEAQVVEEQAMLLEWLEKVSDSEDEDEHPAGMSG
jgi:hypothetical protein